jgi:hypothetical protein
MLRALGNSLDDQVRLPEVLFKSPSMNRRIKPLLKRKPK